MNVLRLMVFLFSALMLLALPAGCNEDKALYDMASFERLYIPALALTGKPDDSGKSVMAIKELKIRFSVLKSRYSDRTGWDDALGRVEGMIMDADFAINANNYEKAHQALEGIRHALLELRRDSGIDDYILDHMTEFHEVMEKIVSTAAGKKPGDLTPGDIQSIARALPEAKMLWEQVVQADINRHMFDFTKGKVERLEKEFANESAALQELERALLTGDNALIIKASLGIKPHYVKVFKSFGNFGALNMGASGS